MVKFQGFIIKIINNIKIRNISYQIIVRGPSSSKITMDYKVRGNRTIFCH